MKINTILFDFDGVIVDSFDRIFWIYNNHILKEFNINPISKEEYRNLFESDYKVTLRKLGITAKEDIQRCVEIYYKFMTKDVLELPLYPTIRRTIKTFSQNNIRMGIVSNTGEEIISNKLKKEGLSEDFKHINGQENGMKPDTYPYLRTLEKLGSKPEDALFIGDMDGDLIGAKNSKIAKVIGSGYGVHSLKRLKPYADEIITKPDDLLKIMGL